MDTVLTEPKYHSCYSLAFDMAVRHFQRAPFLTSYVNIFEEATQTIFVLHSASSSCS